MLDWYWTDGEPVLGQWVNAYCKSRYRDRLKILLMWCKHAGTATTEELQEITRYCVQQYFRLPSYYRIDGKPAFMVWDGDALRAHLGGTEKVRAAFTQCEAIARKAGLPGITFLESSLAMGGQKRG